MTLPIEIRTYLEMFSWHSINPAMLHPLDIERLEKHFRFMIKERGLNYKIEDIEAWSKTFFLGFHESTRQHIIEIAKNVKDAIEKKP